MPVDYHRFRYLRLLSDKLLVLATMAGMMLGLFASALAPNSNSVPLIVILFVMPQVVLGGALIPLPTYLTAPWSTRWGFEAMMAITGIGSDVAADACWALPAEQREGLTNEDKEAFGCNCSGTAMLDSANCDFPGLGVFYNATVDEAPPVEPAPLRDPPPEPTIPERPQEPADQSDTVAMAEFFDGLLIWEEQVKGIQEGFKTEFGDWEVEAAIYQAEVITYQENLIQWQIGRTSAVEPAEVLVEKMIRDYGWTFVDKNEILAFGLHVGSTWFAQGVIIFVLFIGILVFQKRKDVT